MPERKVAHLIFSKLQSIILPPADSIYYRNQIAQLRLQKYREYSTINSRISWKDYLVYSYCILMVIRYLISSYTLHLGVQSYYFRYDIVMEAVNRKGNFDKVAFLLVSSLLLYCIAVHYIRQYCTDLHILNQQNILINQSCVQFWQFYPEYHVQFTSKNLFKTWLDLAVNSAKIYSRMDKFKAFDLENQQCDVKAHAQLVVYVMVIEMVNIAVFVLLKLVVILSVVSYLLFSIKTRPNYSIWQYAFIVLDRTAMMAVSAQCLNNLICGVYLQKLFSYIYSRQFAALNRKLHLLTRNFTSQNSTTQQISKWSKFKNLSLVDMSNQVAFNTILAKHSQMIQFVAYLNSRVISRELFIFVVFNIPFNIYLVTRITFGILPHLLVMVVTTIQLICAVFSNFAAIQINETIHASAKYFPCIQVNMPPRTSIEEKLKILIIFEQLSCDGSLLGYTAGPMGRITAHASLKFVIFYVIYALFSCSLINKSK